MSEFITKKELEKLLEKQTESILGAIEPRLESIDARFESIDARFESIDTRFDLMMTSINIRFEEARQERMSLGKSLTRVENILDSFVGRVQNLEDEFAILRSESRG